MAGNVPLEYFLPYIKAFAIVDGPNSGAKQPDTVYLKDLKSGDFRCLPWQLFSLDFIRDPAKKTKFSSRDRIAADAGNATPQKAEVEK